MTRTTENNFININILYYLFVFNTVPCSWERKKERKKNAMHYNYNDLQSLLLLLLAIFSSSRLFIHNACSFSTSSIPSIQCQQFFLSVSSRLVFFAFKHRHFCDSRDSHLTRRLCTCYLIIFLLSFWMQTYK